MLRKDTTRDPAGRPRGRPATRAGTSFLLAALCAQAAAIVGALALLVPAVHRKDDSALEGFTRLDTDRLGSTLGAIAHLMDPGPYAVAGIVLVGIALARGRIRVALILPVILFGSAITTQALKHALATERVAGWLPPGTISDASWPSGHATAAMTVALCLVLVAPSRLRPLAAAVGGAFAILVAYALVARAWHYPSDVLGGYLVAMTWVLMALGALALAERRAPAATPERVPRAWALRDTLPSVAVAAGSVFVVLIGALARPDVLREHTALFVLGGAIGALALVLAAGLAAGLRGGPPRAVA